MKPSPRASLGRVNLFGGQDDVVEAERWLPWGSLDESICLGDMITDHHFAAAWKIQVLCAHTGEASLILTGGIYGILNPCRLVKSGPRDAVTVPMHSRHQSRANAMPCQIRFPSGPSRSFKLGSKNQLPYQPSVKNLGGGGLSALGRGDLLAVLVVTDTRGRSAVATTHTRTDTDGGSVSILCSRVEGLWVIDGVRLPPRFISAACVSNVNNLP